MPGGEGLQPGTQAEEPRRSRLKDGGAYTKVAVRGVAWAYVRQGVGWLVGVPTSIALARMLSPAEIGVTAAGAFFIQLAARLTRAGLNTALARTPVATHAHTSCVFAFNLLAGTVLAGVLYSFGPALGGLFRSAEAGMVLQVAGVAFVVSAAGGVPFALLRREMRFKQVASVQMGGMLVDATTSVTLVVLGLGFWGIVVGQIAGNAAETFLSYYFTRWTPRLGFSRSALKDLFSFGLGTYASNLLDYAAHNVDNLVVGRIFGVAALGQYDKAFRTVVQVVNRLNASSAGVTFRIFSVIHEDRLRLQRALSRVVVATTMVGYPAFAVMGLNAEAIFGGLFGLPWLGAVAPFQVLCAAGAMKIVNNFVSTSMQAMGFAWSEVWRQVIYVVLLVVGIYAAAPFGLVGASVAVCLATLAMMVTMYSLLHSTTGLPWRVLLAPHGPALTCTAWIAAAWAVTRAAIGEDADYLVSLAVQLPVALLAGLLFVRFAPFAAVRDVAAEIIGALPSRLRSGLTRLVGVPT